RIINSLIDCLERLGQFDQAEAWRRKWLAAVKAQTGADSLPYADEVAALRRNLPRQERRVDAEAILRDGLPIREQRAAEDWPTCHGKSLLGGALLGQEKYADAEPLLLAGYGGMKRSATAVPRKVRTLRLTETMERLVQLYEETGQPDEAAKWRRELKAQRPLDQQPAT